MKFCEDCKWHRKDYWMEVRMWQYGCFHENADKFADVVDGSRPSTRLMRVAYRGFYSEGCETELCGPDAEWFEPKEQDENTR